jgi:hypothetical protein
VKEKDLNRVIVRSLQPLGKAHKISDEAANYESTAKKPFDYFGACGDFIVFGESKFISGGYAAFNFNRIEPHQWEALSAFSSVAQTIDPTRILVTVSVGLWFPHKYFHVVFLDFALVQHLKESGVNSIKKKDFLRLLDQRPESVYAIRKLQMENIEQLPQRLVKTFPGLS